MLTPGSIQACFTYGRLLEGLLKDRNGEPFFGPWQNFAIMLIFIGCIVAAYHISEFFVLSVIGLERP